MGQRFECVRRRHPPRRRFSGPPTPAIDAISAGLAHPYKAVQPAHSEAHIKLNHLNLTASNVLETYRFLEKHFGLKGLGGEPREAMGFLSDDNGMVLALFRGKDAK